MGGDTSFFWKEMVFISKCISEFNCLFWNNIKFEAPQQNEEITECTNGPVKHLRETFWKLLTAFWLKVQSEMFDRVPKTLLQYHEYFFWN